MLFYCLFLPFFFSKRFFLLLSAAWGVSIVIWNFHQDPIAVDASTNVADKAFMLMNLEFIAGMLCAIAARKAWLTHYTKLSLGISLAGLFGLVLFLPHSQAADIDSSRLAYGACFALLIFSVTSIEREQHIATPGWLVKLGDQSYSIYLIHYPVISICSRLVHRTLAPQYASWNLPICAAASIVAGAAYYRWLEKPALAAVKRLVARDSSSIGTVTPRRIG